MSRLSEVLIGMGDTADKVAQTLRDAGIKGKRADPCACPIAKYLRKQRFTNVSVGLNSTVDVTDGTNDLSERNTSATKAFILAFDQDHQFPDLREG